MNKIAVFLDLDQHAVYDWDANDIPGTQMVLRLDLQYK